MDENPYRSPTTEGAKPPGIAPNVRAFERELIFAICINLTTTIFAGLILDGGWIAQHYTPFGLAHLVLSILMYFRGKRRGYSWTKGDLLFLRLGPPVGLLAAVIFALLR